MTKGTRYHTAALTGHKAAGSNDAAQSTTPETDALARAYIAKPLELIGSLAIWDHAKRLERQRDALLGALRLWDTGCRVANPQDCQCHGCQTRAAIAMVEKDKP